MELMIKFVGGPRDKKSRTLRGTKLPTTIEVEDDCKFHNVQGHYRRCSAVTILGYTQYEWVDANAPADE